MSPQQRAAEIAAGVTVPTWIATMAANALPVVQCLAGLAAFVASCLAALVYLRRLRTKT